MIKVLSVDDHLYLIKGLMSVFEDNTDISIVASAESGVNALEVLKTVDVDLVLLDIVMPEMDGVECCKQIKKLYPHIKVIAFTGESDSNILLNMWNNKADSILSKDCGIVELSATIKSVMKGQKSIGKNVPPFLEETFAKHSFVDLTKKETEVLKLLSLGLPHKEIANKLFVEIGTINFHCKNIRRKFGNRKTSEIIAVSKESRLIK
ncbi:MAG: response regulator transcription factor [Bacteroidota bacterium]